MNKIKQSFEYPMFSPHDKAKLYKRFTGEIPIMLKNTDVITIEDNRYVYSGALRWVESTATESGDSQPMDGLFVEENYLTVRTNSLMAFVKGDLILLPKGSWLSGLWIITDGIRVEHIYTPKEVQTYQYLPLNNAE